MVDQESTITTSVRIDLRSDELKINVLGPIEAHSNGRRLTLGGPKQRIVLALLASEAGKAVSDNKLIEGVWGETPSSAAQGTRQTLTPAECERFSLDACDGSA